MERLLIQGRAGVVTGSNSTALIDALALATLGIRRVSGLSGGGGGGEDEEVCGQGSISFL